jgi:hypothetical protein
LLEHAVQIGADFDDDGGVKEEAALPKKQGPQQERAANIQHREPRYQIRGY